MVKLRYGNSMPSQVNDMVVLDPETGGEIVSRPYVQITWQTGTRAEFGKNGCYPEDVLQVVMEHIQAYQKGSFACTENEVAIRHIREALNSLKERDRRRVAHSLFNGTHTHQWHTEDVDEDFSATGA